MADKTFERRDDEATKAGSLRVDQGRYPRWVWLITIAGSILMIVGAIIALTGPSLLVGGSAQINEAENV